MFRCQFGRGFTNGTVSQIFRPAIAAVALSAATVANTGTAWADCTATMRPATAQEKQIYANAFALFQRMAPPAPPGWVASDSDTNGKLADDVCAGPGETLSRWSFSRHYSNEPKKRIGGDAQMARLEDLTKKAEATQKANEARLAEIEKQIAAAARKMGDLASAQKFAEIEALREQVDKLQAEQSKLQGYDDQDAQMKAVNAEASRDVDASFSLTVGGTESPSSAFKPEPAAFGKQYRQQYTDDNGVEHADLVVVLPTRPGQVGQTVVRASGDPARAEALLKAVKFQ